MINRRLFLASAGILAAGPSLVMAKELPENVVENHQLMLNATAYCDATMAAGKMLPSQRKATLNITRTLLVKHGDELFRDPKLILRSPDGTLERHLEGADYRMLAEYDSFPRGTTVEEAEAIVAGWVVEDVYRSYKSFATNAERRGVRVHPFLVVYPGMPYIDEQLMPAMPFNMRYSLSTI